MTNAHWDVAAALLAAGADPNADGPGHAALHLIPKVRKPGVGDNDPAPDGSGRMTSLELVRTLVEHGADVNARMAVRRNLNNTRHHEPRVDSVHAGVAGGRHGADADPCSTSAPIR